MVVAQLHKSFLSLSVPRKYVIEAFKVVFALSAYPSYRFSRSQSLPWRGRFVLGKLLQMLRCLSWLNANVQNISIRRPNTPLRSIPLKKHNKTKQLPLHCKQTIGLLERNEHRVRSQFIRSQDDYFINIPSLPLLRVDTSNINISIVIFHNSTTTIIHNYVTVANRVRSYRSNKKRKRKRRKTTQKGG